MGPKPVKHRHQGYSPGEEIANSVTHGLGVALGIAGLVILVVVAASAGDARRVTAFSIYGGTLIFLYLASTLYHSVPSERFKGLLQRIDHAAIYVFIAGSYTPVALFAVGGAGGWTILGIVWGVAIGGVLLEFLAARRWRKLSVLVYLGMGWTAIAVLDRVWEALPGGAMALLVAGGAAYTVGVVFYLWRRLPYSHAVWHLFVLGGSACHFFLFLLYLGQP
jgi:hemolysin III